MASPSLVIVNDLEARGYAASPGAARAALDSAPVAETPLLSVIIPVYNGGPEIARNVEVIRHALGPLGRGNVDLIVVSDGSIDETFALLSPARKRGVRLIHYDRNLGKGYAVKVGALAARGSWIAFIDADLELDPTLLPVYLDVAQRENLDFVIGSKRHPESVVHYPPSRQLQAGRISSSIGCSFSST